MRRIGLVGILAVASLVLSVGASAAVVDPVYEKVAFVSQFETSNESFTVETGGTYRATLSDLSFPAPFSSLFLAITTSSKLQGQLTAPGSFTFSATPGTTYFANVAGQAGGALNLSLFGVEVALVPIPPAALLLGSAVAGLLVFARRSRRLTAVSGA